jgi:predicted DNA-binding transcriptional regulator AlpA
MEKQMTDETIALFSDRVHTRKRAAEILGCSVKTLTRIEKTGDLRRVQISPRIVGYRDSALRQYLDQKTR